jgi:armadillo repeat-containing protein 6
LIASECLSDLTGLMKKFEKDAEILSDLMLTVSSLLVRNEFCQLVADGDGVKLILSAMMNSFENQSENTKVIRESFKLLKALAGNDTVKADIIKNGAAPIISVSLNQFKSDETIAKSGLLCVSTLSLRVKDNSTALFEQGIAEVILETMKIHSGNKVVQRNGAWAIRNMVSRSRDQCKEWVNLGAEDVLLNAVKNHPNIEQDVKSALRDLGVQVKLIEEWKGNPEKVIAQTQD